MTDDEMRAMFAALIAAPPTVMPETVRPAQFNPRYDLDRHIEMPPPAPLPQLNTGAEGLPEQFRKYTR